MLNKEKWAKEIVEIALSGYSVALSDGAPAPCECTSCGDCDFFNKGCRHEIYVWANSEYVEPNPCANCKVDDKVWVRNHEKGHWMPRYFAEFKGGNVYCYDAGGTSWSAEGNTSPWVFAKPYVEGEEP